MLTALRELQVTAALVALLSARKWFARLDTEAASRTSEQLLESPSSVEKVREKSRWPVKRGSLPLCLSGVVVKKALAGVVVKCAWRFELVTTWPLYK